MATRSCFLPQVSLATFAALLGFAQTSTNITLNLNSTSGGFFLSNSVESNTFVLSESGSAGPLGNAALVCTGSTWQINNGQAAGPVQLTVELAFNELDTITISYTETDPNFYVPETYTLSGGTITGGTGKYLGAEGSLDLNIATNGATAGSGTLTLGGTTTSLTLSNFHGFAAQQNIGWQSSSGNINVSGSLGSGTGTISAMSFLTNQVTYGTGTIAFNSADSLNFSLHYTDLAATNIAPPSSFAGNLAGGTGKYANASGVLTFEPTGSDTTGFRVTGTMTLAPPGAPMITQVKTAYGLPQVAYNTWIQINGTNLVPTDTPAAGVDWSNAPDFANGMMPTQLGPISVNFGPPGSMQPGYVYWYCSAATDPNCTSGDQINVLAPTSLPLSEPSPFLVSVTNNGVSSAPFLTFRTAVSPAFLSLDALGHVAARHLDSSLVGPASLYPGFTTPAKAGEIISVYGSGFGAPVGSAIVNGSATQTGSLNPEGQGLNCWISGLYANVVGALVSPGLYQFNITVPSGTPSGDNALNCTYDITPTFPGALIAVQ